MKTWIAVMTAAVMMTSPSWADRAISGSEVQNQMIGKQFNLSCVNGTTGQGSYHPSGTVTATYRIPTARDGADMVQDFGRVRTSGDNLCITWKRLNDGREGCYRTSEKKPGLYRIANSMGNLWCDFAVH